MSKYFDLLGRKVVCKVTGFKGVVASVSFDLYGCIQAVVVPPSDSGKRSNGEWFDVGRLKVKGSSRVMPVPDFDAGYVAQGKKGAAPKPDQAS